MPYPSRSKKSVSQRSEQKQTIQAGPPGAEPRRFLAVAAAGGAYRAWLSALTDAGHRVDVVDSIRAASGILDRHGDALDAIVLDSSVTDLQSTALLNKMRRLPAAASIPVIKLAIEPTDDAVTAGLNAGIWYYLGEPCQPPQLLAAAESAAVDRDRHRRLAHQLEPGTDPLYGLTEGTFRFRTLEDVERIARLVANACPSPDRVIVGLSELMINAVEHGNLGIGYDEKSRINARGTWLEELRRRLDSPEQAGRYATLTLSRRSTGTSLRIEDCGVGFPWRSYLKVEASRAFDSHGRGIAIARELSFDSIEYADPGNIVTAFVKNPA